MEGGHEERRGLDAEGHVFPAPLHRHEVALDYTRVELGFTYGLTRDWEIGLRVPWEQKAQTASVEWIAPVTPAERESILRNAEIHHRSETYRGLGDLMALARHRSFDTLRQGDALALAFGASLPTGRTEENPYSLGREGERHLHIQFGTGTFDPLLEVNYAVPVDEGQRWTIHGFASMRASLYENEHGYEGPQELSISAGPSFRVASSWAIRFEAEWFGQGRARWDGEPDPNTGLRSWAAATTLQMRTERTSFEATVRVPLSQESMGEGDVFDQSSTFSVAVRTIM